ncbi:hypothetical protein Tco_0072819 [Tanacetum coccineum]
MLFPHKKTFPTPTLTQKLFSNMKRASKGYSGVDIPLFPTMLTTPESFPFRITSSPSLSPQAHPSTSQPPSTPPFNQTTLVIEEAAHLDVMRTYNAALTKLIKRVKKLEQIIKTSQARRRAKVVISDDEEAEEDPSNQGRSLIKELDLDVGISLVPSTLLQIKGLLADAELEEDKVDVQTTYQKQEENCTGQWWELE